MSQLDGSEPYYRDYFPRLIITAEVIKRNKRLYIRCVETGEILYTPPNFIYNKMGSRLPLMELADKIDYYDEIFDRIFEFEVAQVNRINAGKKKNFR